MTANANLVNDNKGLEAQIKILKEQIMTQSQDLYQNQQQVADLQLALKSQNHQAEIMEKTAQFANEDS